MGNVQGVYPNPKVYTFGGKQVMWTVGNVSGNDEGSRVEVADYAKGDVARIFLYVYVRWAQPNLFETVLKEKLPPFDRDDDKNSGMRAIESLETLLQWCKSDPVDEWEMTRNDLTQGIQGNRNVFIDYPELAWKLFNKPVPAGMPTPSGVGEIPDTPDYPITAASSNTGYGTVALNGARIIATPATGYYASSATVTPSGAATVSQSGNVFTISNMKQACTVTVQFTAKTTANIGYAVPDGVTVTNGPTTCYLGDSITLPTVAGTPKDNANGYSFVGWVDAPVTTTSNSSGLTVLNPGQPYTVTKPATKLYALYSYRVDGGTGGANTFVLVKAAPPDWSGDYVMTSPDAGFIAYGITKADGSVSLGGSSILKTGDTLSNVTDRYVISIAKAGSDYSMQLKGASSPKYYSYSGSENSLSTAADPTDIGAQWKISYNAGKVTIESVKTPGRMLQSNGALFRCYTGTQSPIEPIKLYAASGSSTTYYLTLGEGTIPDPIPAKIGYAVPEGVTVVSGPTAGIVGQPITLPNVSGTPGDTTKTYTFAGWVDEKVADTTTRPTIYAAGAAHTIKTAATKLYALFTYTTTEVGSGSDTYTLVTDGAKLKDGDKLIITAATTDLALGTYQQNGAKPYYTAEEITRGTNEITDKGTAAEVEVKEVIGKGVAFLTGGNYIECTSDSANGTIGAVDSVNDNATWTVAIDSGVATVQSLSKESRNKLVYKPTGPVISGSTPQTNAKAFSCGSGPNSYGVEAVRLYVKTTGPGGPITVTHYLTLADGDDVPPPSPVTTPTASPKSGEVAKDTSVTLSCATAGAEIYYTLDGSTPTRSSAKYESPIKITGNTTVKFIAVKSGLPDSAVVTATYTIKNEGGNTGSNPESPSGGKAASPTVKAEDVKVNDGTAEIKLPSADAKLDDGANKKAVSANATKPITITGGGLNIIIPTGTLSAGTDVNALLVNPKATGNAIKVTKPGGTTAILPIAVVSGGRAAYVANIPGKYEVIDNSKTFPDTGSHWALPAIGFVSARELFKGDNAGAFRPDQPMTRGMLATVLARIDGGKAAAGTPFADVSGGSWYAKEIAWAAQGKLVEGDGKDFNPDADLTREQLCVILVRYLDYSGLTLAETTAMGDFSDLSSVSPWAKDAVEQAVKTGLIGGKTGGLLDPQGKATRAEIATILQRFVEGVLK